MTDWTSATVAIDARMIRHSGIGTHLRGLLEAFVRVDRRPRLLLLGPPALLGDEPTAGPFEHLAWEAPIYGWQEQFSLPRGELKRRDVRLFHSPRYNMPLFLGGGAGRGWPCRRLVTVHDLIHLRFAHTLSRVKRIYARRMLRAVANGADAIATVSAHTRDDLMELLGVDPERVHVIHNAVGEAFARRPAERDIAAMCERLALPRHYALTVGINKPHKNYEFLCRVMGRLWADGGEAIPPLVMAGIPVDEAPVLREEAHRGMRGVDAGDRLIFPGRVAWEDIPLLTAGATLLIMPSLYEGFGLPVLEAQSVGTAVAAARATSLPEVGGDAAAYFDPADEADAARVLAGLFHDPERRADLIARCPANVARFSWDRAAAAYLGLYAALL
jgi:glycosyltransferase involved in cell wall biosynthesis